MNNLTEDGQKRLIRLLRISGGVFIVIGGIFFADLGDIASLLDLQMDQMNRLVGGLMMLVGVLDVVLVPRILQIVFDKNRMK